MTWNKINESVIKTEIVKVMGFKKMDVGKGPENIVVQIYSMDGRIFSNFLSHWDPLNIDIEKINEGDELEIQYREKEKDGKKFNNFISVQLPIDSMQKCLDITEMDIAEQDLPF